MGPIALLEIETDGAALVETFRAAQRAVGEFRRPPSPCCVIFTLAKLPEGVAAADMPCPEADQFWAWYADLLVINLNEAWDDLWFHVTHAGPVEVENGIWRLNGRGELTFRRHGILPFIPREAHACQN